MNTAHQHKTTHFVVRKLTYSGAIAYVYCLERGDFSTHAPRLNQHLPNYGSRT